VAVELTNRVSDDRDPANPANLPVLSQVGAATLLGVSERHVRDAVKVKRASQELFQLVKDGSVTVDVAAKTARHESKNIDKFVEEVNAGNDPRTVLREITRLKRLDHIEQKTGDKNAGAFSDGPTDIKSVLARLIDAGRKWPVALIDPPWEFECAPLGDNNRSLPYPTMTPEDLKELPVPDIMTDDAIIFLWATAPHLDVALDLLRAWGFSYRTCAVWIKDRIGMGYWFRGQHELLLVGRRGDFPRPRPEDCVSSVIQAARAEHSEKPEAVYEILETYFPVSSKIELFARKTRKGWAAAGNEIEGGFVDLAERPKSL
jgi:N6-adenosine-specific RNA methylase IME4